MVSALSGTSIGATLTHFKGSTPMRVSANCAYKKSCMSDFIPVSVSSARPLLGFSDVHGCRHQAPASPGMDIRAEKSAVMARRVRVCFLLASVFFVMPAAAQTPGAELDEVSKPTASAGTKVSASEPHEVPGPAITSLIFAAGYHAVAPQVM